MKASKSGTVNTVSPCAGLKIIPLATSESRRGAAVVTFSSRTWATSLDQVGPRIQSRSGDARSRVGRVLHGLHPDVRAATRGRTGPNRALGLRRAGCSSRVAIVLERATGAFRALSGHIAGCHLHVIGVLSLPGKPLLI